MLVLSYHMVWFCQSRKCQKMKKPGRAGFQIGNKLAEHKKAPLDKGSYRRRRLRVLSRKAIDRSYFGQFSRYAQKHPLGTAVLRGGAARLARGLHRGIAAIDGKVNPGDIA